MGRELKRPVARVVPRDFDPEKLAASVGKNERIMLVDIERLRLTKTFGKLRKQAGAWDDAAREDFVLAMIAEGPV